MTFSFIYTRQLWIAEAGHSSGPYGRFQLTWAQEFKGDLTTQQDSIEKEQPAKELEKAEVGGAGYCTHWEYSTVKRLILGSGSVAVSLSTHQLTSKFSFYMSIYLHFY